MLWWTLRKLKGAENDRLRAIAELERTKDPRAIMALLNCIQMRESSMVRMAALSALNNKFPASSLDTLVSAIAAEDNVDILKGEIELLFKAGWFATENNLKIRPEIIGKAEQFGNIEVRDLAVRVRAAIEAKLIPDLIQLMRSLSNELQRIDEQRLRDDEFSSSDPPVSWRQQRNNVISQATSALISLGRRYPNKVSAFLRSCVEGEEKLEGRISRLYSEAIITGLRALYHFDQAAYLELLMVILNEYLDLALHGTPPRLNLAKFAVEEVEKHSSGEALRLAWNCEEEIRRVAPVDVAQPQYWAEVARYGRFELKADPAIHLSRVLEREAIAVSDRRLDAVLNFRDGTLEIVQSFYDYDNSGMKNRFTNPTGRKRLVSYERARTIAKTELRRRAAIRSRL